MTSHEATVPSVGEAPVWVSVCIFWASVVSVIGFFALPDPWCWLGLLAIVPLIHGSHEVLHGTLLSARVRPRVASAHRALAETVGFAVQGMNLELLRPAHLHHHQTGRDDDGFVPDLRWSARRMNALVRYYANLLGLPAAAFQLAGFARLLLPPSRLPFMFPDLMPQRLTGAYIRNQAAVVMFVAYALVVGGTERTLAYELVFCFVWSVQQNVAHYGLRGPDRTTDRVCARTYLLPWPLNWLTFGSTSHFLHHANMRVPGRELYREDNIRTAEVEYGVAVRRCYGLWPYARDLARQFRGPLNERDLTFDWLAADPVSDGVRDGGRPDVPASVPVP